MKIISGVFPVEIGQYKVYVRLKSASMAKIDLSHLCFFSGHDYTSLTMWEATVVFLLISTPFNSIQFIPQLLKVYIK